MIHEFSGGGFPRHNLEHAHWSKIGMLLADMQRTHDWEGYSLPMVSNKPPPEFVLKGTIWACWKMGYSQIWVDDQFLYFNRHSSWYTMVYPIFRQTQLSYQVGLLYHLMSHEISYWKSPWNILLKYPIEHILFVISPNILLVSWVYILSWIYMFHLAQRMKHGRKRPALVRWFSQLYTSIRFRDFPAMFDYPFKKYH